MPLVRVEVRNEYGLGSSELYREAAEEEEPKGVLQGVSVAGLVGILRQLGDLAQFSAEVFHDLQEQVIATAARSHGIINRVQRLEAALPPVEKAVLSQTTHIHFAYSAGTDWHSNIQARQDHLINSDLPQFILESYEECRNPPRLQLLDRFDTAGPGACLKRYSDPSFFKNALPQTEPANSEKVRKAKKANKNRRKGLRHMNREVSQALLLSKRNDRRQFASPCYEQNSAAETISTLDMRSKSDLRGSTTSSDSRSRTGSGYRDSMFDTDVSVRREEQENTNLFTSRLKVDSGDIPDTKLLQKQTGALGNDLPNCSSQDKTVPSSCSITWDEKTEIVKPTSQQFESNLEELRAVSEFQPANPDRDKPESANDESGYPEDILTSPVNIYPDGSLYYDDNVPESLLDVNQFDAAGIELDSCLAAGYMVSDIETDAEHQEEKDVSPTSSSLEQIERECRTSMTFEIDAQSLNLSDVQHYASDFSSNMQMFPDCSESVFSKDLIHAESLPTIPIFPEPDISVEAESYSSTALPEISRVNNIGSARRNSLSPAFNAPSSKASSDDKIINSVCESQVSPPTKDVAHEETFPVISVCPEPDISLEAGPCSSTDIPDVPRVNDIGSARIDSSSSDFTVSSSKASPDYNFSNSVCEYPVSPPTKDLVHEELLCAISTCPKPDISLEAESCSSTDIPDVPRVNDFGSARIDSSSSDFTVSSSKASPDYNFSNSVCEYPVSPPAKDLVHEESLPAMTKCPTPDISLEAESCSSTDIHDVSRVDFGSAGIDSLSSDFNAPSSKISPDYDISNSVREFPVSPPAKDLVHEESLPAMTKCPKPDISLEAESCLSTEIPDVSRVNDSGSARIDSPSLAFNGPSSKASPDDKISNSASELEVSPPTISGGPPTLFWTNGDLLGLAPAKPSDSSVLNLVREVPSTQSTNGDKCALTSSAVIPDAHFDECSRKQDIFSSTHEPIKENPRATEKTVGVSCNDLTYVNVPSPEARRENNEQLSRVLGLSNSISVNIFRRSYLSAPSSSLASGLMKLQETHFSEQKKLDRIAHQASPLPSPKRQFEYGSPVNSVSSSSPPLEHMTISFQPIDGFETSKLKLRFPDGCNFDDNKHAMLPSFQLVPGPSKSQRDIDYESDDDTFSRFSDDLSDDIRSQHSYSNSEQWESNEAPCGEDRDMYDGLRRVLSEESISASEQGGYTADSLSSLPNFDSVIPIQSQEGRENDERDVDSILNHSIWKTAPTDPPTERNVKPPYAVLEDNQDATSEDAIDLNYMQPLQPTTLQQYNPAPSPFNVEATTSPPESKNMQKLNGIKETKKTIASKDQNGDEDLLQQIRTKSIKLKRTVPAKPILMPNPTANTKVTAILEKASAIRQVVGSDEGDDSESWSDQ